MKILEYYLDQNKHKKHLIFDLDETLGLLKIKWAGFRDAFYDFTRSLDSELVSKYKNESGVAQIIYNEIIHIHGYKVKEQIDRFCCDWELAGFGGVDVNQPLVDFVKAHKDNYHMYVWTNQNRATALKALKEIGIHDVFKLIVAKENENISKPFPDGFYQIFDADQHDRNEFLMIGDSDNDEMAALRAGIDFLRIKMGEE